LRPEGLVTLLNIVSSRRDVIQEPTNKGWFQVLRPVSWLVLILLVLFAAAVIFMYFSPDYNLYLVKGQSMEPAINTGDMVITGPTEGLLSREVKPGTIVTYMSENSSVTHRVIAVKGNNLITKGDAVEDPDPKPVLISEVCGVYLCRIPYLGYFSNFMRTTIGWLVVVIAPTILLVGFLVRKIIRESESIA
jgi:signal peptidase